MALVRCLLACSLLLWLSSPGLGLASPSTPLDYYVSKSDPSYRFYDLGRTAKMDGYTVYFLNMTSQTWLSCKYASLDGDVNSMAYICKLKPQSQGV